MAQAIVESNPRVGCWSRGANHGLEEWSPRRVVLTRTCAPHRIRLTGSSATFRSLFVKIWFRRFRVAIRSAL